MKILRDILYQVNIIAIKGNPEGLCGQLTANSREAKEGSVFIAIKGSSVDGHIFIPAVIEQGCLIIVSETDLEVPDNVTLIQVKDSAQALSRMACNFYDNPAESLKLIGITGTNGKTTVATLLYRLFSELGYKTGLLSTVVNRIGQEAIPSTHTTPDPLSLNALLRQMVDTGVTHCFMEVSSHAIHQQRIGGIDFRGAVFTNITHDHLDYHNTFKEYLDVKKSLFDKLTPNAFALVNLDDKNGGYMLQNTRAKKRSYALKTMADYRAKVIENQFTGLQLRIGEHELWTRLIGDFNAYNILAVYGVSQELGEDQLEVLRILSTIEAVEGRFQYLRSPGGITGIVDYAHTPDALENVLKTIGNIRTKNEQVITIVGCGGDRDRAKRPIMADIACRYSDKVVITSDNPRSEEPDAIIAEMMNGVDGVQYKKTLTITERAQAIATAVALAQEGDIILLAGKGHEKYQEIKGVKHPFDDLAILTETLHKHGK